MNTADFFAFFDKQPIIILGTNGENKTPETRAVINIRNPQIAPHLSDYFKTNRRFLIITNTFSEKIAQLRSDATASLYAYDQDFKGLLLLGSVTEVTDTETKDALWDDSWKLYYPDGKDGGDFSVLEFFPETYKSYSNFTVEKGKAL
jgi:general stress protein 26